MEPSQSSKNSNRLDPVVINHIENNLQPGGSVELNLGSSIFLLQDNSPGFTTMFYCPVENIPNTKSVLQALYKNLRRQGNLTGDRLCYSASDAQLKIDIEIMKPNNLEISLEIEEGYFTKSRVSRARLALDALYTVIDQINRASENPIIGPQAKLNISFSNMPSKSLSLVDQEESLFLPPAVYPRLSDVMDQPEATKTLQTVARRMGLVDSLLRNPRETADYQASLRLLRGCLTGVVLVGPPGVGKNFCFEALVNELNHPAFPGDSAVSPYIRKIKYSEIESKWIGVAEQNVTTLFDELREGVDLQGSSILFLAEADSLFANNSENHWIQKLTNHFKDELDNAEGIFIFACTNYFKNIDQAIVNRIGPVVNLNPLSGCSAVGIFETAFRQQNLINYREIDFNQLRKDPDLRAHRGLSGRTIAKLADALILGLGEKQIYERYLSMPIEEVATESPEFKFTKLNTASLKQYILTIPEEKNWSEYG